MALPSVLVLACTGDDGGGDAASSTGSSGTDGSSATLEDSADDNPTVDSTDRGGTDRGGTTGDPTDGGQTDHASDGSTSGSEGSSDSGTDTAGVDPTPILERDPMISHTCTETHAITQFPAGGSSRAEGLVAHDGEFSVLLATATINLSRLTVNGALGATVAIEPQPSSFRRPLAAATDAGIAAVWTRAGISEMLRFAVVDDDQQFVVDPIDIPAASGGRVIASALVSHDNGGYALFYGVADNTGATDLFRLMLDADGQAIGDPLELADVGTTWAAAPAAAVPTADGGQALAYTAGGLEGNEVFFVVLNAAGETQFAPNRISREAGDGWSSDFGVGSRRNVMAVGDDFWVTYTESYADFEQMEGHVTVSLAVVDGEGDAQVHTLQAPTEGTEHRWPSLTEIDDRPALIWTTGTIVWLCAGCISDHDLNLVMLDPDAVVPLSEIVTQATVTNGIAGPLVAVDGPDVVTAGSLDYHVATVAASGSLRCTPTR